MAKRRFVVLTVVLLSLLSLHFSAFEVNTTPAIGSTTVTLYSIADAYVNSTSPGTNYGSATGLYVSANTEQDFTYVKFDLTSIPSGATIISAKLEIFLSNTGGDIYGLPADTIGVYYSSDNSWAELGITWNNKPSFNPNPTSTWSFSLIYTYNVYKSWNVTADVRTALASGILTEVLKFRSKTGNGYALFRSREGTSKPLLEVEYSTQPVYTVNLESAQDTGATSNLGLTTFADYTFSLPTAIDVVAGSYQIEYSGGYKFTRWETSGGVAVSNANAASTTVTVSGGGTLRAVGNVEPFEYTYDYGQPGWESQSSGYIDAVRFTPLFSNKLLMARFYLYDVSSYTSNTFKVHVMDVNRNNLITPFEKTPTSEGWFDVDLSSYNINVNVGTDFYIGMEWITGYNPVLGEDTSSNFDRSWYSNGTIWQQQTYGDFMIRAVTGTVPLPSPSPSISPSPSPTPSPSPSPSPSPTPSPTPSPSPTSSPSPTATPTPSPTPTPTPSPTASPTPTPTRSPSTSPSTPPSSSYGTQGISLPNEAIYAAVGATVIVVIVAAAAVILKKRQKSVGEAPPPPPPPPPPLFGCQFMLSHIGWQLTFLEIIQLYLKPQSKIAKCSSFHNQ